MKRRQDFSFGFSDSLLAEVGKVPQDALHFDVEAICQAYESIKPIAKRLGVQPPKPRLAGFCYTHVAALGAKVTFPKNSEPNVAPLIRTPSEIDQLCEPEDYLQAKLIQERLRITGELKKRSPDTINSIGHLLEGPVTTATLLMGSAFLTLPYDDPERAHRLLEFSVRSALNYARAIRKYFGEPFQPGPKGFPDDFGGMFPPDIFGEFVVPYWEQLYQGLQATERTLHSELLRVEHMPFLAQLRIDYYDPSADQYLTPELLRKHCPAKFTCRIQSWHIRDLSVADLQAMYRHLATFEPYVITFCLERLDDEPKIQSLLEVAREMKGE